MNAAPFGRRALVLPLVFSMLAALVAIPGVAQAAEPDAVELTTACEGTDSAGFTDTEDTTFEFEIDCFAHRGFTRGTGNGSTYRPFGSNTRWQMATFIFRVLEGYAQDHEEFDVPEPSDQGFDDIGALDPEFRDAINVLAELNIVQGRSTTRYEPYATVRRDQMASFINRATGAIAEAFGEDPDGYTTDEEYFPDVSGNVHEANINGIASEGIVQGRSNGRYNPADPVNRGQMSAFIMRWVQTLGFDNTAGQDVCEGALTGVQLIDSNGSGALDLGDLLGLDFDVDLDQLLDEGVQDILRLQDDDGSIVELQIGQGESLFSDNGLDGGLIGDNGTLQVAILDDNVAEVATGDVEGLDISSLRVVSLTNGFGQSECDEPAEVEDGDVQVLDIDTLDNGALQDIVDALDALLGDLVGSDNSDTFTVDNLLDGALGDLFDGLLLDGLL